MSGMIRGLLAVAAAFGSLALYVLWLEFVESLLGHSAWGNVAAIAPIAVLLTVILIWMVLSSLPDAEENEDDVPSM